MNRFQQEAIERANYAVMASAGQDRIPIRTSREGIHEQYYRMRFSVCEHQIEIFVYEDEVGFMINDCDWHIFETPDYNSPRELIDAFIDGLVSFIIDLLDRSLK